jgi:carbonic anhydrase
MSAFDEFMTANRAYTANYPADPPGKPRRQVAVVVCMDARIDVYRAFGLQPGDAHVLRNAGGLPTDDVLRSLAISQRALGTREVAVVHHTQCGMGGFDDTAFRAELATETGVEPGWDVPGFVDVEEQVRRSVAVVRDCPWLPHRDAVRGFVFDVATGALSEVR